jgi:hypothetical protein
MESGRAPSLETHEEMTTMRNDDVERLPDDVDIDRVRATPRGIAGGWIVVAAIALLMATVPPAICLADTAVADARQKVTKVEHRLGQVVPLLIDLGHAGGSPASSQPARADQPSPLAAEVRAEGARAQDEGAHAVSTVTPGESRSP